MNFPAAGRLRARLAMARRSIERRCRVAADPAAVLEAICASGGPRVVSGPFAGMRYVGDSHGSVYLAKLLGTYEMEANWLWTADHLSTYSTVINIGCGEGYYLAGVATLVRRAGGVVPRLVGLDIDESALASAKRLLELNELPLAILATDGFAGQLSQAQEPVLVICDIEGAEESLLDPAAIPGLATASILAEIHDLPGDDRRLTMVRRWYQHSHDLVQVEARSRTAADFPSQFHRRVAAAAKFEAMDERRLYGNRWLWMTPRGWASGRPTRTVEPGGRKAPTR